MLASTLLLALTTHVLYISNTDAALAGCVPSVTKSSRLNRQICQGELIFEDQFNTLNLSKWSHEITMAGGGNNEFQIYWDKAANSAVSKGILSITPGKTTDVYKTTNFLSTGTIDLGAKCTASWNNGCKRTGTATNILPPATSARLHTTKSFSFAYGRVKVRAKMPAGDWIWPAIWLMPQTSKYGVWPRSGELDMMETRGNRNLTAWGGNVGVEQALSTMHWGPQPSMNKFQKTAWYRNLPNGAGWDKAYHLYQMEWTPDYIKFSIDNLPMGNITPPAGGFWEYGEFSSTGETNPWASGTKMAPFDEEFFLILNIAVGGTSGYFPDSGVNLPKPKPWLNSSPQPFLDFWNKRADIWNGVNWKTDGSTKLNVDYVKVWAL